jgi:hypothetical protein
MVKMVDGYYCKVVAYAGYKANERPLYFTIKPTASNALDSPGKPGDDNLEGLDPRSSADEQRHEVRDIISRWAEPEKDFFKVIADDGRVYTLSWHRKSDMWVIEKITEKR